MRSRLPLLAIGVALSTALPVAAADQAGVSAAVTGQIALSRPQVAVGRQVVGGEPILLQDAIQSGPKSGMQILLLDETVFTIGPESALVIDEFVYDPSTGAGKLSAEITKGVFRFVTGRVAKDRPENMSLRLPSGTLGVRGTMVGGRVDDVKQSATLVLLGEGPENDTRSPSGAFEACNAGACVRVNRPGFATIIEGPGLPPTQPFLFPTAELDKLTQAVSDPKGWVETATSGDPNATDVAAGPGGGGDGDSRSASEISGRDMADGSRVAERARERLERDNVFDELTNDAAQDEVNPRSAASDGSLGLPGLGLAGEVTSFDELTSLAATGLQTAAYAQSGLGLVNQSGEADGSYDFSLVVNLGARQADLSVSNLQSESLGLNGQAFGGRTDFSSYGQSGIVGIPFGAAGEVRTSVDGPCDGGCAASAAALLFNGSDGRIADSVIHGVVVSTPSISPGVPGRAVVGPFPSVEIRRP